MDSLEIQALIDQLLEASFFLPDLDSREVQRRHHDDHEGRLDGVLTVAFDPNGDAYVWATDPDGHWLRFRTAFSGGGQSPRVNAALKVLARAIQLDNRDYDQQPVPQEEDL